MKITTLEVAGIAPALKGMRNPMNSWKLSDTVAYDESLVTSEYCLGTDCRSECQYNTLCEFSTKDTMFNVVTIGPKDLDLAQRLIKAGGEHSKFMRQIQVWVDIDAPRYFWSEFETYHFNTKNSCSTMHKLFQKDRRITIDDFEVPASVIELVKETVRPRNELDFILLANWRGIISGLNALRDFYFEDGYDKTEILRLAKQLLPEGFLQLRTVNTNYAELRNMYMQRKNHRLEEWSVTFCEWVESLPYAKELILYGLEKK